MSSSARDRHGQNELCAEHCTPCRHHGGQARGVFLAGNEQEQLASRIISTEALVGGTKLRTGDLTEGEWTRLVEAGDILSKADLYLDDSPGITVPEMKAKVRRLKDVDLVIIDYLQLMNSAKRIDNRVQEISEITRSLKIMAKELNIPVVTLAQLARAGEKRQEHRPVLSDLRDSGSIEQDADIVLFLYRDAYYANEKLRPKTWTKTAPRLSWRKTVTAICAACRCTGRVSSCALHRRKLCVMKTEDILARVRYDLPETGKIVVGLSGGADSVLLTYLLAQSTARSVCLRCMCTMVFGGRKRPRRGICAGLL